MGMCCSLILSIVTQLLEWMVLAASNVVSVRVRVSFCAADPFGSVRARLSSLRSSHLRRLGVETESAVHAAASLCAATQVHTRRTKHPQHVQKPNCAVANSVSPPLLFLFLLFFFYIYFFFAHKDTHTPKEGALPPGATSVTC